MSSLDKSRSEEDGKEDSPPRKIAGLHKMGIGGNILAEMKKIQEKRTSFLPKVCRICLWASHGVTIYYHHLSLDAQNIVINLHIYHTL